jgi:hypothetical protein
MAEKQYKYTAKIKQPQTVADVKIDPKGGVLSEREYKTLKKDAYGASLLEKGLLVVEEAADSKPVNSGNSIAGIKGDTKDNTIPDFDAAGSKLPKKE